MDYHLIDDREGLDRARGLLGQVSRLSLDCEAAGFHRYSDRLTLVQLSTTRVNLILDPLALDLSGFLRPLLEDPNVQVVMHGADYDVRLLDRDLDIHLRGLFDTQVAASLLGAEAVGLAALLLEHLGVSLPKGHQRADWAQRPLPEGMLEYAANDTRHLLALADVLTEGLQARGREAWAEEEFRLLEEIRWEEDETDPVTRVKGARDLNPREVTALREALDWRDTIARAKDRAPFRVVGDPVLLEVVLNPPSSKKELGALKGMSSNLARQYGGDLLSRLGRVRGLSEENLEGYPPWQGDGAGRPSPEEEAQANRLRELRTGKASELGLDRGVLLSNAQIMEVVRRRPGSMRELRAVSNIRNWQVEVLGREILQVLGV